MEDIGDFKYITEKKTPETRWGRPIKTSFPFRVGDLVKVTDWGGSYCHYTDAFKCFKILNENGSIMFPYYAIHNDRPPHNRAFKILDIAEHESFDGEFLFYIKDNENREAVVGGEYLIPLKTFPLRPGETKEIKIKRI